MFLHFIRWWYFEKRRGRDRHLNGQTFICARATTTTKKNGVCVCDADAMHCKIYEEKEASSGANH